MRHEGPDLVRGSAVKTSRDLDCDLKGESSRSVSSGIAWSQGVISKDSPFPLLALGAGFLFLSVQYISALGSGKADALNSSLRAASFIAQVATPIINLLAPSPHLRLLGKTSLGGWHQVREPPLRHSPIPVKKLGERLSKLQDENERMSRQSAPNISFPPIRMCTGPKPNVNLGENLFQV
ncbi:hypothetical protein CLAIMM_13667 isoform 2 [Cladophialophora immunda]|nr:hypothetical protein CLAIMM_13667 isoform 1 [Cladophialophora immunda]OQV09560.1 hypothetical protein CLAIMM_13667 isoform 2 [Cladophialophora immunda]